MSKIIKFFAPNLKLAKGSRLISALFVGASMAIAAGVIFGANIYYDIDTSKIMVGDTQQATTTQITVTTGNTTALTVTQRGTAAAFLATSTSAMTSDIFKITNLGSGLSFVVEDSDTDGSPFIVNNDGRVGIGTTTLAGLFTVGTTTPRFVVSPVGYVGIASSTPSDTLAVQGNIIGSGNLVLYGSATSTYAGGIQATAVKLTTSPSSNYVLTSDANGFGSWQSLSTLQPNTWQFIGPNAIRPTSTIGIIVNASSTFAGDLTVNSDQYPLGASLFIDASEGRVGIGTTTLAGLFTVGTTTPRFVVSPVGYVGIASSTPSETFAVQGNMLGMGNIVISGTINTGQGATEVYLMDQAVQTTNNVTFATVDTGQGANELYAMNQNVRTTDSPTFGNLTLTFGISSATGTYTGLITATGGIISQASSTFTADLTVGNEDLFVDVSENKVGIASSTPSDTLAVQGNIIGSGNITIYGTATSTIGGQIAMAGTELKATGGGFTVFLSSAGSLTLQPQSDSDVKVLLGGTGQLKVGSSGQFYIDASGNATTSGNIYASAFITSGANASVRKTGEQIVRGVAPIFGFDLPARCNTSCTGQWATISRTIENTDFFPPVLDGTTRKYRFSIRYADATTTVDSIWQIATSTDNSSYQFTLNATESTNLDQGYATTTNTVSTLPSDNWFLRAKLGGIGGYNLQVYEVLLIGLDEMN